MSQQHHSSLSVPNLSEVWRKFYGEARTRILLWYVLIVMFILLVSIPAFRLTLYARVDARVRRELREKIETFKTLVSQGMSPDQLVSNLTTGENSQRLQPPSSSEELKDFFDEFLLRQLPEDDTFLIAFVNGRFYKSSPRARPKSLQRNSPLMQHWAKQIQPTQGEYKLPISSGGDIIYMIEPVTINRETIGVFVVAHTIEGERREVLEAIIVIIQISSCVFVLALILTWIASGKVLAPLRLLSVTARSISVSDLQKRIPIQGKGEIAELATTFNEMMERLSAVFTNQRNFINDAGHELRTPITIIRGHLELMGDDPQEIEETRTLVLDEIDRMSRIVEDLILLAKTERPDFLRLEIVDVTSLTQELFAKAQALATRNWCLDAIAKGYIIVDRQRITQAVMNLAQNATQHTQNTDTIGIGSDLRKNEVRFWVRDTGEGIADGDQKRIFERFARATNSRRRSEGAGLGLSIVKAIVEAHFGKVLLYSQPGKGAIFTIVLPLAPMQTQYLEF